MTMYSMNTAIPSSVLPHSQRLSDSPHN